VKEHFKEEKHFRMNQYYTTYLINSLSIRVHRMLVKDRDGLRPGKVFRAFYFYNIQPFSFSGMSFATDGQQGQDWRSRISGNHR
jgi:hypothetical protein